MSLLDIFERIKTYVLLAKIHIKTLLEKIHESNYKVNPVNQICLIKCMEHIFEIFRLADFNFIN